MPDPSTPILAALEHELGSIGSARALSQALRLAALSRVPTDPRALRALVAGPLYVVLLEQLGESEAANLTRALSRSTSERKRGSGIRRLDPLPTVMIVEDDPLLLRSLRRALASPRYDIVESTDGVAALESLYRHQPQVIVTDHQMPNMTGAELAWAIHDKFAESAPPMIVWSAATVPQHLPPCVRAITRKEEVATTIALVKALMELAIEPSVRAVRACPRC
jgi:CheY-like chemotaxis protein